MKLQLLLSVAVLSATAVLAKEHDSAQAYSDQHFIQKAAKSGKMEVEMGKLAAQKASDPQVKQFGQRLVDDHTRACDELKPIAQRLGINLEEKDKAAKHEGKDYNRSDRADATAQNTSKDKSGAYAHKGDHGTKKLESLTGSKFDEEFIRMALKHHKKDVAAFEKASQQAQDPQLKQFAARTLPVLQQHLQTVQQLARTRNITEASGAEAEYDSDSSTDASIQSDTTLQDSTGAAATSDATVQPDQSSTSITVDEPAGTSTEQSTSTSVDSSASTSVEIDAEADKSDSQERVESSVTIDEAAGASNELPSGLDSSNPNDQKQSGTTSRPSEPQRGQESNTSDTDSIEEK